VTDWINGIGRILGVLKDVLLSVSSYLAGKRAGELERVKSNEEVKSEQLKILANRISVIERLRNKRF